MPLADTARRDVSRDLRSTCRYVLLNPVRAGLVERARDWPWSHSLYGWDGLDG